MAKDSVTEEYWQHVEMDGDEDAYRESIEPVLPRLIAAAARELRFYVDEGAIHADDFSAEEVTGEALMQAWEHREHKPDPMSMRGWLLGTQHRVLARMVEEEQRYRSDKAVSLDEPVPHTRDSDVPQERFSDLYQPERHVTWEDVTPSQEPVDYEVPMDADKPSLEELSGTEAGRVVMMHDEFEMDLSEVAYIMNRRVNDIAAQLGQARVNFRERTGGIDAAQEADQPAPPEGSDV